MNARTKTGLQILQVAVVIGILGNLLLRVTPWGLNVLLFNAAFAAAMIGLLRRHKPEYLTAQTYALFGAQVFFAAMFVWRDATELRVADSVAIIAILSVLFIPKMKLPTQVAGVFQYGVAFLWSSFNAFFAPFALVFNDIEWNTIERTGWSKHAFSVFRGVAIATPILLIFGGLFIAADAVYEGWVRRVFNIEPDVLFTHVLLTSIFAWFSAGYLRGVMIDWAVAQPLRVTPADDPQAETRPVGSMSNLRTDAAEKSPILPNNLSILEHINLSDPPNIEAETRSVGSVPSNETDESKVEKEAEQKWNWQKFENTVMPPAFTLGSVEIGVILGLTNLLFLSFVIVQVPYLFGGMELVQSTPDFKLADYARRGFGELVTVSALVLPILLASHWLIRKDSPLATTLFRVFAGIQIGLLFVIMASAGQRLVLLTGNLGYGLTTIRLYPMIFMIWLAVVFVWFAVTVLRGARQHFAWGALWSAFLILGATHVLNPDAFIVKTNVALMKQGREFDPQYNARLSGDATPALIESIDSMSTEDKCWVDYELKSRNVSSESNDFRSFNLSRYTANRLLETFHIEIDKSQCVGKPWL